MKVLVADDDKISRLFLKDLLTEWGYEVLEAGDGERAWQILKEESPCLLLMDWVMPKIDGPELCRRLRVSDDENYHYVILLTGRDRKDDVIEGLEAGADDYITKPFVPQELEMRLRVGRRILELQHSLQEALEGQRYQAQHDPLTGILNRGEIVKVLERELNRAERQYSKLTIMMADLDHFKKINDTFGHAAGDAVLVEVAQRMRKALRIYDTVGRYGGEEFLLMLPGCEVDEARLIANRILNSINSQPVMFQNTAIAVTISLGLTINKIGEHTDLTDIVQTADSAMYQAKQNGRNRFEIAIQ